MVPLKSSLIESGALGSSALICCGTTLSRTRDVKLALAVVTKYLESKLVRLPDCT